MITIILNQVIIMKSIAKELKILIESQKLLIKESIQIDDLNNLLIIIETNKPVPIKYYSKNLIEIKTKLKCISCNKVAQYKSNDVCYCWIHAHSLV